MGDEKTLVTENSRNGKKEALPRRHGGHGEGIRQRGTADCAEDADRIFYVRFGLRPARKPSAEWNRNILLSLRGVAGCQRKSKDPPGQNQAGWGTHFKIVCWLESRRVGHPPPSTELTFKRDSNTLLHMGASSFSIKLDASVLVYAAQKFLGLFDRDDESKGLSEWFKDLQRTALVQSQKVQCLGMRDPLPFDSIYQPTRLIVGPDEDIPEGDHYDYRDRVSRSIVRGRAYNEKLISVDEFLRRDEDALIFSGPGWGKTTFLHHIFRKTFKNDDLLPVLITLRRPKALEDLEKYVEACARIQKKHRRACTLLLVDGYDEVNSAERQRVSEALFKFQARGAGKFYLSCREYYEVSQLQAPEVRIDAFTRDDQVRFVGAFLSAFGVAQDPDIVVSQLESRGFTEFLSHPLLLTLACIARTSSSSQQPRSALRLLERALDVLCYQWDEQRSVDRQGTTTLDGHDRRTILKSIAYRAKAPFVPQQRAEENTRQQLSLMHQDRVDPRQALMEIARFYGILVPSDDGYEFVHRTIHDFLAAQYWVESGEFAKQSNYEWTARTGYAACLASDATDVLKQALAASGGLPTATEIIGNSASFNKQQIADALIQYYSQKDRVIEHQRSKVESVQQEEANNFIKGSLADPFIRLANSIFLDFVFDYCCSKTSKVADLLVAYAAVELYERRKKLQYQTYEKALANYKTDRFLFIVPGAKQARLEFLNPRLTNRMKNYPLS